MIEPGHDEDLAIGERIPVPLWIADGPFAPQIDRVLMGAKCPSGWNMSMPFGFGPNTSAFVPSFRWAAVTTKVQLPISCCFSDCCWLYVGLAACRTWA